MFFWDERVYHYYKLIQFSKIYFYIMKDDSVIIKCLNSKFKVFWQNMFLILKDLILYLKVLHTYWDLKLFTYSEWLFPITSSARIYLDISIYTISKTVQNWFLPCFEWVIIYQEIKSAHWQRVWFMTIYPVIHITLIKYYILAHSNHRGCDDDACMTKIPLFQKKPV